MLGSANLVANISGEEYSEPAILTEIFYKLKK